MKLNKETNYIISGLERSGTSMIMQILNEGNIPIEYDNSRKPDENNPKGYYELDGGKIINKLIKGKFPFEKYKGKFIKITAYGLTYLPIGKYIIIYIERNLDEVLDSMEKMAQIKDNNRNETKEIFRKLNEIVKRKMLARKDIQLLVVNYNEIMKNPQTNVQKICDFIGISSESCNKMMNAIDKQLYRNKK